MKRVFLFLLIFCLFNLVYASDCIDINSASLADLDKLEGIGPAYAQRIIDARPFLSIEELDRVSGIGPKTIEKIKSQGMACVSLNESIEEEKSINEVEKEEEENKNDEEEKIEIIEKEIANAETIEPVKETIMLNSPQTINLNQNKGGKIIYESKNEKIRKYSIYGFCLFLIFIIIALLIKR